jgi:hypothetical protein
MKNDSERDDSHKFADYLNILNDLVYKKNELGLDVAIEVEIVSKVYKLNMKRFYIDIVGSLPNIYQKQVNQFIKYVDSLRVPGDLIHMDVKINPHITDKFPNFQQITDIQTGEVVNFEISSNKVTLVCYYNVLKNVVDGFSYPYVSESMKYLHSLGKLLEGNEGLRKKVKVAAFTCNKEEADFINKFIWKKKLKYIEHYFISEYKLVERNELSLGSQPLIILIDKNKVIRYFGNPLYMDLELNIESLYNGFPMKFKYHEKPEMLLTPEEQNETIEKLNKFYKDGLGEQKQCFSSLTFHSKKVVNEPIANLDGMRCSLIAEVDNLTYSNKSYVDKLVEFSKTLNPKIEIDFNNIYMESIDEDRSCCFCQ